MTAQSGEIQSFVIGGKELQITDSKVRWENKMLNSLVHQPNEIKFGGLPIEIDLLTVGTKYQIDLRDETGSTLRIPIKSYFRIGIERRFNLYQEIVTLIWNNFFADMYDSLVNAWENGDTVRIGDYEFDSNGMTRKEGLRGITMTFDEMDLQPRTDHLLINSKIKDDKWTKIIDLEDWNSPLVKELLYHIKGIE